MIKNSKLTIYKFEEAKKTLLPLFSHQVKAGFPSPADDHIEQKLDLNHYLIQHPAATFFVRVEGNSMKNAGISSGDLLIVDRALSPKDGKIILAVLNGEFTVKRIRMQGKKLFLNPENPHFSPLEITEDMDFQIWGVVTYAIHACSPY
ncbi:MAG: translesion error-prone DNA polymerase V autoproteolytic subunit [Chlamydiia bacterium]|nr:translesion error-prone DNA polymerase V autoproteolytic subunit [Chlamydiia bacterium]